jgi:stearoyl-CoA desaturase (delta-9 desaturase)
MISSLVSFVADGLVPLPWWGYVVFTLAVTHVTIAGVTIYLHRHSAHRALDLHPAVSHFFRLWLWLTTGMVTREWTAIHRKHHAKVETPEDPHSPQTRGIWTVLLKGAELYRTEAKNQETLERYGRGTPDDWVERNVYSRFTWHGVAIMLIVDVALFGAIGLTIWAVQMVWIPFFAAGVINGIGHYWGYRNFACEDTSANILPFGILVGGEELHNNHHAYGSSAKLSSKWYEFDIGWLYIRILETLGLAAVRKVAPKMRIDAAKTTVDLATLQAVITHRYAVLTSYARSLRTTYATEIARLRERARAGDRSADPRSLSGLKRWLATDSRSLGEAERTSLAAALESSRALKTAYQMRQELSTLWERSTESSEQLLQRLQDWCRRAEASGVAELQRFSFRLRQMAA